VGVSSKCLPDGSIPHEEWMRKAGHPLSPNGKTYLGMGRPFFMSFPFLEIVSMAPQGFIRNIKNEK